MILAEVVSKPTPMMVLNLKWNIILTTQATIEQPGKNRRYSGNMKKILIYQEKVVNIIKKNKDP